MMARDATNPVIRCRYFHWVLRRRNGVFFADGRSNRQKVGRHSLGTRDREEALQLLEQLDRVKAVELGRAKQTILDRPEHSSIELQQGWSLYREYLGRPEIAGGASRKTRQRYKAIVDKFIPYAESQHVRRWNDVTTRLIEKYLRYLEDQDYADRTIYAEATVVKQILKWLTEENLLPKSCLAKLKLKKVHGTNTYCWTREEVTAMIEHCRRSENARWLAGIIVALAHTGLRISELASLRWPDVDFTHRLLSITNDRKTRTTVRSDRRTKNRRDRSVPIHDDLYAVLQSMPEAKDGIVFHGPRGGRLKPDVVRNALIRDVITPLKTRFPTTAGAVGFEHGRLHSFRHFFCSVAANAGIPEAVVMKWLGHRSSEMVRHYYHLHDVEARKQIGKIDFANCVPAATPVAGPAIDSDTPDKNELPASPKQGPRGRSVSDSMEVSHGN